VTTVSGRWLTFAIALTGITGSVASDAVIIVLPPLAAMAFLAVGRSPLLGIGRGEGPGSRDASQWAADGAAGPAAAAEGAAAEGTSSAPAEAVGEDGDAESVESMRLTGTEKRGLRNAALALVSSLVLIAAAVAVPGSPLRGEDGTILTGAALMHVPILIALVFVAVGVAYGLTVGSIAGWADLPEFMVKGMKDVAPVLVLFFIAWFEWSNIGTVLAVSGADLIESLGVATPLVMVGVILMTFVLNLFITSGSAQWTLMAPVIVPAMMLLGVSPETSQVLFRIGDSGSHLITPLNVYFALMLTYLQRYRRDAGIGTLVSMTLPVCFAVLIG